MQQWQIDAIRKTESGADWFPAWEHELAIRTAAHATRERRLNALASRIIRDGIEAHTWDNGIWHGAEYIVPGMAGARYTLVYWNSTGSRDHIVAYYWNYNRQPGSDLFYHTRIFRHPYTWSESIPIPPMDADRVQEG
jgi:hypothetical protein